MLVACRDFDIIGTLPIETFTGRELKLPMNAFSLNHHGQVGSLADCRSSPLINRRAARLGGAVVLLYPAVEARNVSDGIELPDFGCSLCRDAMRRVRHFG